MTKPYSGTPIELLPEFKLDRNVAHGVVSVLTRYVLVESVVQQFWWHYLSVPSLGEEAFYWAGFANVQTKRQLKVAFQKSGKEMQEVWKGSMCPDEDECIWVKLPRFNSERNYSVRTGARHKADLQKTATYNTENVLRPGTLPALCSIFCITIVVYIHKSKGHAEFLENSCNRSSRDQKNRRYHRQVGDIKTVVQKTVEYDDREIRENFTNQNLETQKDIG